MSQEYRIFINGEREAAEKKTSAEREKPLPPTQHCLASEVRLREDFRIVVHQHARNALNTMFSWVRKGGNGGNLEPRSRKEVSCSPTSCTATQFLLVNTSRYHASMKAHRPATHIKRYRIHMGNQRSKGA